MKAMLIVRYVPRVAQQSATKHGEREVCSTGGATSIATVRCVPRVRQRRLRPGSVFPGCGNGDCDRAVCSLGGATEIATRRCVPRVAQRSTATVRSVREQRNGVCGRVWCVMNRCVVDAQLRSTAGGLSQAYLVRVVTIRVTVCYDDSNGERRLLFFVGLRRTKW